MRLSISSALKQLLNILFDDCGWPWYKNTKSVGCFVTIRSVLAPWPEKPWLHEKSIHSGSLSQRPLPLPLLRPPHKDLLPNLDEGYSERLQFTL